MKKDKHQKKCYKILNDMLNRKVKLYVQIEEIIENEDMDNGEDIIVRLGIITEDMLKYDMECLKSVHDSMYRPYFLSFLCKIKIDAKKKFLEKYDGRWVGAYFEKSRKKGDSDNTFWGQIEFSASPVIYKKRKIVITDEEVNTEILKAINDTYQLPNISEDLFVENKMNDMFKGGIRLTEARIYKIGNGNMIEFIGEKKGLKKHFFFDVGYNRRSRVCEKMDKRKYNGAINIFRKRALEAEGIVISHWDTDHIMGCVYAPKQIFEKIWFVPSFLKENDRINARRLASYVNQVGTLVIVDREKGERKVASIKGDTNIALFIGSGIKGRDIGSEENNSGLVLEVVNEFTKDVLMPSKKVQALFPGDVAYDCINKSIWYEKQKRYDYLLASHHGSAKMNVNIVNEYDKKMKGVAIISVGKDKYRPHKDHIDGLKKKNYNVYITEECKNAFIKINLLNLEWSEDTIQK